MTRSLNLFTFVLVFAASASAQLPSITIKKNKGTIYLAAGYNRGWFSKSDIHLHGKDYDFTLFDADGVDSPQLGSSSEWSKHPPQLHFRAGYFFKSEDIIGIEIGLDQLKYSMVSGQTLNVQGVINDKIIESDTLVTDDFVRFSHPDGVNYLMLNFIKGFPVLLTRSEIHSVFFLLKPGIGLLYPRTTARIMGENKDSDFRLSGYVLGLEASIRYILVGHVIFETGGKVAFANFSNIQIGNGESADHSFESAQWLASIGYQFHF